MSFETDAAIHAEEANPSVTQISVKQLNDEQTSTEGDSGGRTPDPNQEDATGSTKRKQKDGRLEKTHIRKQLADVKASDSEPEIHPVLPQTVSEQPTPMKVKTADPRTGRTIVCYEVTGPDHSSSPDTPKDTSRKEEIMKGVESPDHSSSPDTPKDTSQKEEIKKGGPDHSSSPNTPKDTSQKEEIIKGGPDHNSSPDTPKDTYQKEKIIKGSEGPDHNSSPDTSKDTSQKEEIIKGVEGPDNISSHDASKRTSQKEEIIKGGPDNISSPDTSKDTSHKEEIIKGAPMESSRKISTFVQPQRFSTQKTGMNCHKCRNQLVDGADFCSHCRASIPSDNGQVKGREQRQEHELGMAYRSQGGGQYRQPQHQEIYTGSPTDQPRPDEPSRLMENKNDLRILLVGRTGHGKSATGNSLLGITKQEGFHEEKSISSVTATHQRLVRTRFGRILEVVDTPGIMDTGASYEQKCVYEQIAQCVGMTLPGFNAVVLVLFSDRFTKELVQTVEIFFKMFGRGVDEYAFVLLTHIDTEEEMKNYIKSMETKPEDMGVKAFQVLSKRCQGKLLFIENRASKDIKEEMVWNILTAVDTANAKSLRPYFANKLTREIEKRAQDFYWTHVSGSRNERSKEDLRILLIGLPGHGKSATGNSLLGKNMFTANASTVGNAYHQTQSGQINGRKVQIVEFPVKIPSIQSEADLKKQLLQTEKMLHPGFHAVCFVINPNKFSEVKDQFLQVMKYFGDEASDYAFVIMTFSKSEDEFEEHFPPNIQAENPVTYVLKFCKGKELYIDNMAPPQEKKEMIEDILSFIDCENGKKVTPHFSSRFKQLTEASEAAKTEEAAKAAEAAKKAETKHKEELLRIERETFETYKRDLDAKQHILKLEYEVRLKEIEKKNMEQAAEADRREKSQKELEEKNKEERQREREEQEEKRQREREEQEEKRQRERKELIEKQHILQMEFEVRLKEIEKKNMEQIAAEAERREKAQKELQEMKKEKRQKKREEQEEKRQREREEQEEKRQREREELKEKQHILQMEYEVRLKEIEKKNMEQNAEAERREKSQKELEEKKKEKRQKQHEEQEKKRKREREEQEEKRQREREELKDKQHILQMEYEVRLKEIEKKNMEQIAAEAERREKSQKELEEKKKEKRQRKREEQEEKRQRERKEQEKQQREREEQAEKFKRELKELEEKFRGQRQHVEPEYMRPWEKEMYEAYKKKLENDKKGPCTIQ